MTRDNFSKHETVSFIIQQGNKYLMFYHSIHNNWSIPIGKFDILNEKPFDALAREAFEELDIVVENAMPVDCRYIVYNFNEQDIISKLFMFKILKYKHYPINKEPEKHSHMFWMTREEISALNNISEATKVFLEVVK